MKRMWSKNEIKQQADTRVKSLVEGGTLDNAKPIYCHPLEIYASGIGVLTALIFNNSSEKIDTWGKLKAAIGNFNPTGACRLLVSGGVLDTKNSKNVIASEIYLGSAHETFYLLGYSTDGTIYSLSQGFDITNIAFSIIDDVNKIN